MPKKKEKIDKNLLNAYEVALDKKALNIVMLDLREYQGITDYFLICSGTSNRHAQAICDGIMEKLGKKSIVFQGMEGYNNASWILIDYTDFVVHVFKEESRDFYSLERLWGDAKQIMPGK